MAAFDGVGQYGCGALSAGFAGAHVGEIERKPDAVGVGEEGIDGGNQVVFYRKLRGQLIAYLAGIQHNTIFFVDLVFTRGGIYRNEFIEPGRLLAVLDRKRKSVGDAPDRVENNAHGHFLGAGRSGGRNLERTLPNAEVTFGKRRLGITLNNGE